MESIIYYLVAIHTLGALIGTGTAIWSEIEYIRAIRDGKIDSAEDRHLLGISTGLKYGMSLMLLTSLALVVVAYLQGDQYQPALMPNYWLTVVLALVVVFVAWSLTRHTMAFPLGSAIIFTAWWFLAYLALGNFSQYTFGSGIALFVILTGVFYALLQYIRFLSARK